MESTQPVVTRPSDEDIISFENQIREEQVNVHPLVSIPLPIDILRDEYHSSVNPNFLTKISELTEYYSTLRKTRGDGNCFFRAFSFALVEAIWGHSEEDQKQLALSLDTTISNLLQKAGFERLAYEDFYSELFCTIAERRNAEWLAAEWEVAPHRSHSLVVLLRLVASAYLRAHAEEYEPFVWELESGMVAYCQRFVECLGVESDQIHIIVLGKALGVDVHVAYLDGSEGPLNRLFFRAEEPSEAPICINVLYRPGHYDILYPRQ